MIYRKAPSRPTGVSNGESRMPTTLITGANRGLGLEFARQYVADGWQVYAACRNPKSASELHHLADASGHTLQILALDVTNSASVKAAAAELDGQPIDLLLNNAGIGGARGQTIGNIDYEAWAKVLDVNTMGPIRVSEAFVDPSHAEKVKHVTILTLKSIHEAAPKTMVLGGSAPASCPSRGGRTQSLLHRCARLRLHGAVALFRHFCVKARSRQPHPQGYERPGVRAARLVPIRH